MAASSSKLEFETFNAVHFSKDEDSSYSTRTFHPFPRLPAELRLKIWSINLSQRRLVNINLKDCERLLPINEVRPPVNHLDKPTSGNPYTLQVPFPFRLSPLLHTTRESRQAALDYYHIRIPTGPGTTAPALHFNADNDVLYLSDLPHNAATFIDLISDFRACDRRDTGVLHLMINSHAQSPNINCLRSTWLARDESRSSFTQCVLNLRTLWIFHALWECDRITGAILPGHDNDDNDQESGVTLRQNTVFFNRTAPLFPRAVEFDFFDRDPRPLGPDFRPPISSQDPRIARNLWLAMEHDLGLHHHLRRRGAAEAALAETSYDEDGLTRAAPSYDIAYVVSVMAQDASGVLRTGAISDPQTMDEYLKREAEAWNCWEDKLPILGMPKYKGSPQRHKELLSTAGFWVLPESVFDDNNGSATEIEKPWPALGVFKL